jgi:hypothetical protein
MVWLNIALKQRNLCLGAIKAIEMIIGHLSWYLLIIMNSLWVKAWQIRIN